MQLSERARLILGSAKLSGLGLEIGPSYNPIASKRDGFRVEILDHAPREELIEKYRDYGVNIEAIEEVDYIWRGESYTELVGTNRYDYIIASHVIEHTVDLIQFINDCDALLKEGGQLCLAVPNKLYCFDYLRPPTPLAKFIDTHIDQRRHHTPGTAAEYYLNVCKRGEHIAWSGATPRGDYQFIHNLQDATDGIAQLSVESPPYLDLHNWCFTPHHFLLVIQDLLQLGYINLGISNYTIPPGGLFEFFVQLSRSDHQTFDRLHLHKQILRETYQVIHENDLP